MLLAREAGDEHLVAVALRHTGQARLELGDVTGAAEELELAARLRARIPDPDEQGELGRALDEVTHRRNGPDGSESVPGRSTPQAMPWGTAQAAYRP